MSNKKDARYSTAYRNKRTVLKARDSIKFIAGDDIICWLCREPIDMSLPPLDAMAWTLDHIDSIANGGDVLGQVLTAHRKCNSARGGSKDRQLPLEGKTRAW